MKIALKKLNFTMGPVMIEPSIRDIGAEQVPYFRTKDFSKLMLENEALLKKFLSADTETRIISLTGSGTSGMEATVINTLNEKDKVLIVNGGGFGKRFVQLCQLHHIPYEEICLPGGRGITSSDLEPYDGKGFTAFLVNHHETSTGVLYNMEVIASFCRKNSCFLIVDAISSFLADEFQMERWGVNAVITGSQKAYAIPPGLSLIALDARAQERVMKNTVHSLYFDFKLYLKDGERGQTPFTPAVGILIQLNCRLNQINTRGFDKELQKTADLAADFRKGIKQLPYKIASDSLSNSLTPLFVPERTDAYQIFEMLEEQYQIWVCPSGGELRNRLLRIGHIGNLTLEDNDILIHALKDILENKM